ncbi:MAG TPA: LysR substrate-binding domain-containing protein [Kiloniellales bacterium]|nr:LysR substrate-binding domain-containing protein [Kiloniellales bacterium]
MENFGSINGLAAREALVAGRGLSAAHRWLVEDLLAEGQLEPILPGWTLLPVPLHMLMLPERGQLARIRLLIDFLGDQIATLPGLERSGRGD